MTVIVGRVDEYGNVYMGGDSSAVDNGANMLVASSPQKVFRNGEFLFGCAGSFRWVQLLQFIRLPKCPKKADVENYLAVDFANALRNGAREIGFLREHHGQDELGCAAGLVAFRGRLFIIQDTFDVIEIKDGLAAVGAGASYALGALKALINTVDAETAVRAAMEISEYYCSLVRGPFHLARLEAHEHKASKSRKTHAGDSRRHRQAQGRAAKKGGRHARVREESDRREHARETHVPDGPGRPQRPEHVYRVQRPQGPKYEAHDAIRNR